LLPCGQLNLAVHVQPLHGTTSRGAEAADFGCFRVDLKMFFPPLLTWVKKRDGRTRDVIFTCDVI
jgi:hypothetical protein